MTKRPPNPFTSPKPLPTPLAMSAAPSDPTPSPLPIRSSSLQRHSIGGKHEVGDESEIPVPAQSSIPDYKSREASTARPHLKPKFPKCKLRIICQDLDHPGSSIFFSNNNPSTSLSKAVNTILSILYSPTKTNDHIPPTRSVSVTLRSMGGVAYTTGSDIDDDHKEIHFSLDYINSIEPERRKDEIQGVLVHEMVHCWQWNGLGTAPGGLIEGIADFVRLKAGLNPPHWQKERSDKWDAGYQHTGYFLEWIEGKWGGGSVSKINEAMRDKKYVAEVFWLQLFDKKVEDLWKEYSETLPEPEKKVKDKECKPRQGGQVTSDVPDSQLEDGDKGPKNKAA